jgi:hypothetical protein
MGVAPEGLAAVAVVADIQLAQLEWMSAEQVAKVKALGASTLEQQAEDAVEAIGVPVAPTPDELELRDEANAGWARWYEERRSRCDEVTRMFATFARLPAKGNRSPRRSAARSRSRRPRAQATRSSRASGDSGSDGPGEGGGDPPVDPPDHEGSAR